MLVPIQLDLRLTSNRWRLGTCVPVGGLDQEGYLSRYQQRLTRLSLVTDGTCPETLHRLEGVARLSCLTAFEWEGLQHPSEVDLLRQCIRSNSNEYALSIGEPPVIRPKSDMQPQQNLSIIVWISRQWNGIVPTLVESARLSSVPLIDVFQNVSVQ
jgi:hypothetical protein